jgi:orotidine-5'-phosphate decarboxylase
METSKICLAADGMSFAALIRLTRQVRNLCYAVKVHDQCDTRGPKVIRELRDAGATLVWVDYKLHDIPKTVEHRAWALASKGAKIITVHASGGVRMMQAAMEGVRGTKCLILAVTVLTSLEPTEIARSYGADRTPKQIVLDFALMAKEAGVHGLVCSAQEVKMLADHPDLRGMLLFVPGVRSPGADVGDQKRVGTPRQAINDGASLLVVGREVTEAADPLEAIQRIINDIS